MVAGEDVIVRVRRTLGAIVAVAALVLTGLVASGAPASAISRPIGVGTTERRVRSSS